MKKIIPILLVIFLSSCSLGPLSLAPTPTPAPTQTMTFTPPPTATPVLPTQTFTLTPTLVGIKSPTPTPVDTATTEATATSFLPTLPPPATLSSVKMDGFVFVTSSLNEIYKSKGCEPSITRITAQVASMDRVGYVLLFARFKSLKAERASKWTTIPMSSFGAGTFIHDLSSDQMREDAYFETSWIEYQIVSTTQAGTEIGRTDIFKERLKMLPCVIEPTATSANVKP
jgi:hypothetical protein